MTFHAAVDEKGRGGILGHSVFFRKVGRGSSIKKGM